MGGHPHLYADEIKSYGFRKGYLGSVAEEPHWEAREMVLMGQPESDKLPLIDVIFTSKLTRKSRKNMKENLVI